MLPSVVQITTGQGLGSGVVYDDKGDIVTNAHVVGSAKTFQVSLATGGSPLTATLVASFPANDLAVIRLDSPPSGLKPADVRGLRARWRSARSCWRWAAPLGLSSSVTQGIVSATGRTVSEGTVRRRHRRHHPRHGADLGRDQPGQQRRRAGRPRQTR